jgi:hypothetical protein
VAGGNRDLKKETHWREIVDKQKQSGKSQTQFCQDEGLIDHQFCYWKNILAKRQRVVKSLPKQLPKNEAILPFVPLNLPSDLNFSSKQNNVAEHIEISKITFRISLNTDKTILACILQSLEKA